MIHKGWTKSLLAAALLLTPLQSATARPKPADVRLYVLDCGYIRTGHTENFGVTPQEAGTTDMAVPCYLIRHGKDWLVFDTGLGDARAGRGDKIVDMTLEVPRSLGPQLAALKLDPASIRYVAISHFHFDHIGNIGAFPNATLLVQKAEAEQMIAAPYPFSPADAQPRLKQGKVQTLDGDHDVFGDGSVVLLSTPGHSPGHQSMLVRLKRTGPVLLTGDLYHYPAERRLGRIPPFEKGSKTPESRARIEKLVQDNKAQLWIEHDLDRFKAQRHAPQFYD